MKLALQALLKIGAGFLLLGLLLFWPAGTLAFTKAWLFIVLLFGLMLFYPLVLVKRIRNEETVLKQGLSGYEEYTHKVRYRLLPFIW